MPQPKHRSIELEFLPTEILERITAKPVQALSEYGKLPEPQDTQRLFLEATEDIVIYGGAAGGGKTFATLLDAAQHVTTPGYNAAIFRRTYAQITNPKSVLDESRGLYYQINGALTLSPMQWRFPSGATISLRHLQHAKDIYTYQGAQICKIYFEELTHFTEEQFWYLLSRNRSTCGIPCQFKATTNPDADSWVARLLSWWIGDDGFPIPERCERTRWFIRENGVIMWGDSREELEDGRGDVQPKSVRFIPAKLSDNAILSRLDPAYRSNLMAQSRVERSRLLDGNWKTKSDGGIIRYDWLQTYRAAPAFERIIQSWDTAATNTKTSAYWGCTTWGLYQGKHYLIDAYWDRHQYASGYKAVVAQAHKWRPNRVLIENKSTGITLLQDLPRDSAFPFPVVSIQPHKDKLARLDGESPWFESGRVLLPADARWRSDIEMMLVGFPNVEVLDVVDSVTQYLHWCRTEQRGFVIHQSVIDMW